MPRDHARMRLDMWSDEDYTSLTSSEQWLYERLLMHAGLSYCGVTEWRPGRLAASAVDLSAVDVEMFAVGAELKTFLVIDRDTEEVLIRSFVKHDKLMDKWNMAAAVANSFHRVASKALRGVIVHELQRFREKEPDLRGWARPDVQKVLGRDSIAPTDARRMLQPNPEADPKVWDAESPSERVKESPKQRGISRGKESPSERGCPTPTPAPNSLSPGVVSSSSPLTKGAPAGADDDETSADHTEGRATA